jgi:hypothetical protein
VSLYDWLLFLHVMAAFALVSGLASFGVLVLGDAPATRRALVAPAIALWNVGGIAVLVLGIGLAIEVDAYQLWDGWILGAIVLWLVVSGVGGPLSRGLREPSAAVAPERARVLFAVAAAATLLLLVDMVFKPGA